MQDIIKKLLYVTFCTNVFTTETLKIFLKR